MQNSSLIASSVSWIHTIQVHGWLKSRNEMQLLSIESFHWWKVEFYWYLTCGIVECEIIYQPSMSYFKFSPIQILTSRIPTVWDINELSASINWVIMTTDIQKREIRKKTDTNFFTELYSRNQEKIPKNGCKNYVVGVNIIPNRISFELK